MTFEVSTWFYMFHGINMLTVFMGTISMISFICMVVFKTKYADSVFIISGIIVAIVIGIYAYYDFAIPYFETNKEYTFKIKDTKAKNELLLRYFQSDKVKKDINNTYNLDYEKMYEEDNIPLYKYDYDYITINALLSEKEVTFSQFLDYLINRKTDEVYDCKETLHAITKPLLLDGKLEKKIENGEIRYVINGYTLYPDNNLSSLNLNEKIKLDIVYNNEKCNDDKTITEYKVINASNY